jgi:quinohemoprotein ethanol dehydrogenase
MRLLLLGGVCVAAAFTVACSRLGADRAAEAPAEPATTHAFANVDARRLAAADDHPGQWMSTGRDYNEQRFSPLKQINAENVTQLGLAWFGDFDTRRGQESTPIVVDGALYVTTAWSKVYA